jgi:PAS domain S-box-containing protein
LKDSRKTKAELIQELEDLRAEMAKLQTRHDALEIVEEKFRNALVEIAAHQEEAEARNERIRQVQREQEISHRRYVDLFQSAPVGYVILDGDGVIVEINQTLAQWFGYDRMELIGNPLAECISHTCHDTLIQHLSRTVKSGQDSVEIEFLGTDHAAFFAAVQSVCIRDELTDSVNIRSAVQDMTLRRLAQQELERYRDTLEALVRDQTAKMRATDEKLRWEIVDRQLAEQALTESREKYRVLFQTFPLGICITDEDGWIMEVNKASEDIMGLSSAEQVNRRFDSDEWQVIRPDGSPMPARELPSVIALKENRSVENVEMGLLKGFADVVWLNVTAAPIPVKGYGVAVAFQDVTDRKLAEERIIIHQEQLRRLASELSVAGERERSRIAVDLHDGVAQALTLAKMKAVTLEKSRAFESESARTLREIRDLIEQTLNDTRTLILDPAASGVVRSGTRRGPGRSA